MDGLGGRTGWGVAVLALIFPGTNPPLFAYLLSQGMVMKAYLANIPTAVWALAALPALAATRCVVAVVLPQVVHAVVPNVLQTLMKLI